MTKKLEYIVVYLVLLLPAAYFLWPSECLCELSFPASEDTHTLPLSPLYYADEYCVAESISAVRIPLSQVFPRYTLSQGGAGKMEGGLTVAAISHHDAKIQFINIFGMKTLELEQIAKNKIPCGKKLMLLRSLNSTHSSIKAHAVDNYISWPNFDVPAKRTPATKQ